MVRSRCRMLLFGLPGDRFRFGRDEGDPCPMQTTSPVCKAGLVVNDRTHLVFTRECRSRSGQRVPSIVELP